LIKYIIVVCAIGVSGCEQTFNLTTPTAPTIPGSSVTVTNTNTNTATNTDKTGSDTSPGSGQSDDVNGVIPLPAYGESVVRSVASSNSALLANSCQEKFGESAWAFLDLAIRTLQMQDARWGYLCKDATCSNIARDIVAYRASSGNNGIWIVDVIGNHCPGVGDMAEVRWGVLPFETTRPWIGSRR
jgi:hypothetical protein